jgi:hypothetical protein
MNAANTNRYLLLLAAMLLIRAIASFAQEGSADSATAQPAAPAEPQYRVDRIEALARECATEIPWRFDLRQA